MKARGTLLSLLAAAAIGTGLAQPQDIAAKSGYFVFPAYRESQLTVKGTHGFVISVTQTGHDVSLEASQGSATAIYILPVKNPARDGIRAKFPGVGRVSVRFHPSGEPRHSPPFPGCRGGEEVLQRGTFSGTIRFRGERGFTRVAVENARGTIRHASKEVCKNGGGNFKPEPSYSLDAHARSHGRTIGFSALQTYAGSETDRRATYFASTLERRQGMLISRVAIAHAGLSTFAVMGPPTRPDAASVAPPAPFHGTATYAGTVNGQADWQGTLAVDLPGVPGVQLAGPPFSSSLCFGQRCTGRPRSNP